MTAPLLQVDDLVKTHVLARGRRVVAVRGVSLSLAPGCTLGLVGESGCGKTTLGRCVLRLEEPDSGRILLDGDDITSMSGAALRRVRRRMQMVFQDPQGSLDGRWIAAAIVAEPFVVQHLARGKAERARRVAELLGQVGLPEEVARRFPHELSGGQRQRLAIARALACEPRLLVADEPTSSLDAPVRAQVLSLLRGIQRARGLGMLFISHDLHAARAVSHAIAVMYLGRIVEQGPAGEVAHCPLHPYARALVAAAPSIDRCPDTAGDRPRPDPLHGDVGDPLSPPPGCAFHPRCPLRAQKRNPRCEDTVPPLLAVEEGHRVACHEVREKMVMTRQ